MWDRRGMAGVAPAGRVPTPLPRLSQEVFILNFRPDFARDDVLSWASDGVEWDRYAGLEWTAQPAPPQLPELVDRCIERPALSVVIPLFNEARRVGMGIAGIERLRELVGPIEVIWVDDGSTDATVETLRATCPAGDIVLSEPHRGKGGALAAGVTRAQGKRVLLTDVDWSVSPAEAAKLLAIKADIVIASRETLGARRVGEPVWRHWLGRAFNLGVRTAVGLTFSDTQCGCKLLDTSVAQQLFAAQTERGWAYDVELLLLAKKAGFSVNEVGVRWQYEGDSRVKPLGSSVEMALAVWRLAPR